MVQVESEDYYLSVFALLAWRSSEACVPFPFHLHELELQLGIFLYFSMGGNTFHSLKGEFLPIILVCCVMGLDCGKWLKSCPEIIK